MRVHRDMWARHFHVDATSAGLMRRLAFVELMELLEFSLLRLDRPRPDASRGSLIGTLDWWFPAAWAGLAPEHEDVSEVAVYVYSDVAALREAVLPGDGTVVDFSRFAQGIEEGSAPGVASGLRLYATADPAQREASPALQAGRSALRVDLKALLNRVVVPMRVPQHMFDLVASVVRARVWVDVARPDAAWTTQ